jgi:mono/diheme cytochrome c family protein
MTDGFGSARRFAALAVAGVLAAGCGGSGESAGAGQGAASTTTPAAAATASPAAGADGRAVFMRTCVTCHQQNGQGIQGTFPPIAENTVVTGDKARLIRLVLHGLSGPVMVKGTQYNNVMPPWKSLSDAEMAAVLTYVRSNFGNTADAVTAAEVAAERAATASRTTMWTARELDLH